jgi:hypothetical protein
MEGVEAKCDLSRNNLNRMGGMIKIPCLPCLMCLG